MEITSNSINLKGFEKDRMQRGSPGEGQRKKVCGFLLRNYIPRLNFLPASQAHSRYALARALEEKKRTRRLP